MPFFTTKGLRARGRAEALGGAGMGGTDTSLNQPGSTTLPGGDEEAEVAPPGREKQVRALKKKPGINPFAVAWASYNKSKGKEEYESMGEVAPPGWEGTVKHMKKHPEISNPYALAWYMKDQGDTSHKKESATPRVRGVLVEHAMSPEIFRAHMRRYAEAGLDNFGDKKAEPFKANEDAAGTDHQFPTPVDAWRTDEGEAHIGFKVLSGQLAKKGDVRDPDAVAAAIGRKKYGAKGMAAKSRAGRTGEVPSGIISGDPVTMQPLSNSEGEDHEGRFVAQSEAIEAIGGALMGPLQRKGVKTAPPQQPDLITKSGDAQDIPLGAFKDDLQRKQSLRKMMKGDKKKQKASEAIAVFNEAYA